MFTAIKNFFVRPSNDFFGPEANDDNLECAISLEKPMDHLVLGCNEGIERVRVIDEMAKAIAESDIRPTWLRHNGSVEVSKLRETITMSDMFAKKLLTEEGFVKLSDLHFFDRESVNGSTQRSGMERDYTKCDKCRAELEEVTTSKALALRIQMGASFDPKAAKGLFKAPSKVVKVDEYQKLGIPEPVNLLAKVKDATVLNWKFDSFFWTRTGTLSLFALAVIGASYYTGYVPTFSVALLPTL
ncbi:hypothetical protein [Simkania negevensis]|uniref:Uncharacterized protein n=1 Tax=Simkania negevensis (strain ATCC VR-1471 / DSM 27360 / Z) TaxID=331113 RepID=F8L7L3_SIMNZ|nr:hypothetical protein [Simkania negevensis]CCB88746.1 unknown protein [Simkania negevensis Z]